MACRPLTGAVSGEVVFSAEDAEAATRADRRVILVRIETSPEDINGMNAGGRHSHHPGGRQLTRSPGESGDGQMCRCRL